MAPLQVREAPGAVQVQAPRPAGSPIRAKRWRKLSGSTGVPVGVVKTRPVPAQIGPAVLRRR